MPLRKTPQCYTTTLKVIKVVNSCLTVDQLSVALNMMKQIREHDQWQHCVAEFVEKCNRISGGKSALRELSVIHYGRMIHTHSTDNK